MNTKCKSLIITSSVIIIIILLIVIFIIIIDACLKPYYIHSKETIEKQFRQDKESLIIIKDYFMNDPIASSISKIEYKSKNYNKLIKEEKINIAFKYLFEKEGYKEIGKQKNAIYFLKWTRGSDLGMGITYSTDFDAPKIKGIIKLEALSEDGWYFYEMN